MLRLYSQALTALGATCSDNCAAAARFHTGQETVCTCAFDFGGLVCAFHDLSSYFYLRLLDRCLLFPAALDRLSARLLNRTHECSLTLLKLPGPTRLFKTCIGPSEIAAHQDNS